MSNAKETIYGYIFRYILITNLYILTSNHSILSTHNNGGGGARAPARL